MSGAGYTYTGPVDCSVIPDKSQCKSKSVIVTGGMCDTVFPLSYSRFPPSVQLLVLGPLVPIPISCIDKLTLENIDQAPMESGKPTCEASSRQGKC